MMQQPPSLKSWITLPVLPVINELEALLPAQWAQYHGERGKNNEFGVVLGGCSAVKVEDTENYFVVIRNRKIPIFQCPYGHGLLAVRQTNTNSVFPKGCLFYTCNEQVTLGNETAACGYNIYPVYPNDKMIREVVAGGGDVTKTPQLLKYAEMRLQNL